MRTLEDLQDALDHELAWRRVEIQAMRSVGRGLQAVAQDAVCRAGVAMLYAHWEGYVRAALAAYLSYVARRRLKYRELSPAFVARGVEYEVKRIGATETQRGVKRAQFFIDNEDTRARFSPKEPVDARSNLSSEVCQDLLVSLGLDDGVLSTKRKLIDYHVVQARNEVAHGNYLTIAWTDFVTLQDEVLGLLSALRLLVLDAAENQQYRRSAEG